LRQALGEAERWGIVPRNVAKLVTPPRVNRDMVNPFTPEEARTFIQVLHGDRFEALFVTTLHMDYARASGAGRGIETHPSRLDRVTTMNGTAAPGDLPDFAS
jgi:integrase